MEYGEFQDTNSSIMIRIIRKVRRMSHSKSGLERTYETLGCVGDGKGMIPIINDERVKVVNVREVNKGLINIQ
jgi:hypothetical protein